MYVYFVGLLKREHTNSKCNSFTIYSSYIITLTYVFSLVINSDRFDFIIVFQLLSVFV